MKSGEFNDIILPMRDNLLGYALRLTGSADNAEDLVQEVMLRLWDMRSRLATGDRLNALAMTMTRNLYLDQQRHENHMVAMDGYAIQKKVFKTINTTNIMNIRTLIMAAALMPAMARSTL